MMSGYVRRLVAVTLLLAVVLTGQSALAAGSFSSLYPGNNDCADAYWFAEDMKAIGWVQDQYRTYSDATPQRWLVDAVGSTMFYYSTHGYNVDNGYKWHTRYYEYNGDTTPYDRVYPSRIDAQNEGWTDYYDYIGDEWIYNDPTNGWLTNTKWSGTLRWGIIAACNQIENHSLYTNDGASKYGRTMLGNLRMHQLFGYHQGSPGDPTDVDIIRQFVFYANDRPNTLQMAWHWANEDFGYGNNWSIVYHYDNRYDELNSPTLRTSRYSEPHIYFLNGTLYGNGELPIYDTSRIKSFLSRLLTLLGFNKSAFASAASVSAPVLIAKEYPVDIQLISREFGFDRLKTSRRVRFDGGVTLDAGDEALDVYDTGAVRYRKKRVSLGEPAGLSVHEAFDLAKRFVSVHGGLPGDAELQPIRIVQNTRISLEEGVKDGNPEIVSYIFEWKHSYGGIPISGLGGDRIVVEVSKDGVIYFSRLWRKIEKVGATRQLITQDKALELARQHYPEIGDAKVTLVYHSRPFNRRQGIMLPAWEVRTKNNRLIYVDATDGSLIK